MAQTLWLTLLPGWSWEGLRMLLWVPALALALDRWRGEPPAYLHPVVGMGRALQWVTERHAPAGPSLQNSKVFWLFACYWCTFVAIVFVACWGLQHMALQLVGVLGVALLAVLLKPFMAWRMLLDEVRDVELALGRSLDEGRMQLARLVSRDVHALTAEQVRESAIETLAENLNDSVVAPLFWFVVAGLPGAAVYRLANTADAMWGYPGMRGGYYWQWAGKWAARADDLLSWVPARITAMLLAAVARNVRWRDVAAQAGQTPSPNGGWPMATMALALGVRLGKPGVYVLNARARAPSPLDTRRALQLATDAVLWLVPALALLQLALALVAGLWR